MPTMTISTTTFSCSSCGDEDCALVKDKDWGWVCDDCKQSLDKVDRETDWDRWEQDRRERIAEQNEY